MQTLQEKTLAALLLTAIPCGVEILPVTATSTPLASVPANVRYALCTVEGAAATAGIRYWLGTGIPTVNNGLKRLDGSAFDLIGPDSIRSFKAFLIGASATVQVQYFR